MATWIEKQRDKAKREKLAREMMRQSYQREPMSMTQEELLSNYPSQPEYFQQAIGVPLKDLIVRQQ